MLELLQKLFIGHLHKWKIIEKANLTSPIQRNPFGTIWTLQCEHCGNIKMKKIEA